MDYVADKGRFEQFCICNFISCIAANIENSCNVIRSIWIALGHTVFGGCAGIHIAFQVSCTIYNKDESYF